LVLETKCTTFAPVDGLPPLLKLDGIVLSISGDGGFLFSAMELETAVRLKANLVHMILIDGSYDMVAEQEILKYYITGLRVPISVQSIPSNTRKHSEPRD
jgi:thiamine pyrophosphate-dependent acetolactate synthase large subunit-like protein